MTDRGASVQYESRRGREADPPGTVDFGKFLASGKAVKFLKRFREIYTPPKLGFSGLVTQAALGHPGYWA